MPLKRCTKNGQRGWKFGDSGTCYIGKDAKDLAIRQSKAMFANGYTGESKFDKVFNIIVEKFEKR